MGCRHGWVDNDHIVMAIYIEAPWTWDEFMQDAAHCFDMVKTHGKPCATLVDVTGMGTMPNGNALRYLSTIETTMPDNVFASVLVGAPDLLRVLMDIIMRLRPRAKRVALFAKSHDDARAKIMERYAQLNTPSNMGC